MFELPSPPDNDLAGAIDVFFRDPQVDPVDGWVSTLFLCRRELQDCLIGTVIEERLILTHDHHQRFFATAMVAFAGMELLAGFARPGKSGRGRMFVEFATTYSRGTPAEVTNNQAEVLWNFRNALSHTFGLFHFGPNGETVPMYLYDQDRSAPVVRERGRGWEICIDAFVELFLMTISRYREHLESDARMHAPFLEAFAKCGRLYVRGPHIAEGR